jgi:hypothetical protein
VPDGLRPQKMSPVPCSLSPLKDFLTQTLFIPVYILSATLAYIPLWVNFSSFYSNLESVENWETITENPLFLKQVAMFFYGLITIFSLLHILLIPFWQSLKSVIYYQLLRREEMSIERNKELSNI